MVLEILWQDDEHAEDEEESGRNGYRGQKSREQRGWGVVSSYFVRNCRRQCHTRERLDREGRISDENAAGCWKRDGGASQWEAICLSSCHGPLVESSGSSIEGKVGQRNIARAISSPRNELLLNTRWKRPRDDDALWNWDTRRKRNPFAASIFRLASTVSRTSLESITSHILITLWI